jgi:hypothetical protein
MSRRFTRRGFVRLGASACLSLAACGDRLGAASYGDVDSEEEREGALAASASAPMFAFPHPKPLRGLIPSHVTRAEQSALARTILGVIARRVLVGPAEDVDGLCGPGELRTVDTASSATTVNQLSMAMLLLVLMDDGQARVRPGGGAPLSHRAAFNRLNRFHARNRLVGSPLMAWRVARDGTRAGGSGFVGEQLRAYALLAAARQWRAPEYADEARLVLARIMSAGSTVTTGSDGGGTARRILTAGETWGVSPAGIIMADFGGGQTPAMHRVFARASNDARWAELPDSTYWMLGNLQARPAARTPAGVITGLVPNFMGVDGAPPYDSNREYFDELDTATATYRFTLEHVWFGDARAREFLRTHADWATAWLAGRRLTARLSPAEFELDGRIRNGERTHVRALSFGNAAMVAGGASRYQTLVNEAYDVVAAEPSLGVSFHILSKLLQLLVLTGQFPNMAEP